MDGSGQGMLPGGGRQKLIVSAAHCGDRGTGTVLKRQAGICRKKRTWLI